MGLLIDLTTPIWKHIKWNVVHVSASTFGILFVFTGLCISSCTLAHIDHVGIQRGGGRSEGPDPTPEKQQENVGFLSNTGPDPLKNQANIDPLAKRHFNGILLAGRRWPAYSGIWIRLPPHQLSPRQKTKKHVLRVGPPLTKLFGSAHADTWTKHIGRHCYDAECLE